MEIGKFAESISLNESAIKILREHSVADPENEQAKDDLTSVLGNLSETYEKMKDYAKAEAIRKEIVSMQKVQFKEADDTNFTARGNLAMSYSAFASLSLKQGKSDIALANYRFAEEILKNLNLEGDSITNLAVAYEGIGDALLSSSANNSKRSEAKAMYQKSLEIWKNKESKGTLTKKDTNKPTELAAKIDKSY
jgi:tetratricopeptide (TPR) repeat protein